MASLVKQRMKRLKLTPELVARIMSNWQQRSIDMGDGELSDTIGQPCVPKAYKTGAIRNAAADPEHILSEHITDAIDTLIPPQPASTTTCSRAGTEERIAIYAKRFAAGEAIFHPHDFGGSHENIVREVD